MSNKKVEGWKRQVELLRNLERLLKSVENEESEDLKEVKKAVKNILLRKEDAGSIIVGIHPNLCRIAESYCKNKDLDAADNILTLLKLAETYENPVNGPG